MHIFNDLGKFEITNNIFKYLRPNHIGYLSKIVNLDSYRSNFKIVELRTSNLELNLI